MPPLEELSQSFSLVESVDDLLGVFLEFLKPYGFFGCTLGYAPIRRGQIDSTGAAMCTTLDEALLQEYQAAEMATFDLLFELMATRTLPYTKSSIESLFDVTPQQQSVIEYADRNGIGDALLIPLSTRDYCRGATLFTEEPPDAFAQRVANDTPVLRHAAALAMQRAEQLGYGQQTGAAPVLTDRETECLQLAAQGKTIDESAANLGISERTVRFHLANASEKLGTPRRAQAITRAIQQGLIRT
ncbi:response regulator transcription factor [Aeoliella sp.]|uniref:helix-turn-helix transcriptional regulator n=1 Tax=Aeoliella sp. TaxID=2795800 RepID=UPI003CCB8627